MPPVDIGFGDQKIGDFLSLSDTPALREKYYNALQSGLDSATTPAQPDQAALFWQGIVPALATALLTKGKSAQFSGAPMLNVLQNEQKRADDQQKLTIEAKLKGAGLMGDELSRRETLATTAAGRAESLAETTRHNTESEANQKLSIRAAEQAHADSQANMNLTRQQLQEQRKTQNDLASEKEIAAESQKYGESIHKDLQDRQYPVRYTSLQAANEAVAELDKGNAVATNPVKESLTKLYTGGSRNAYQLIQKAVDPSMAQQAGDTLNWLMGTNETTIPPDKIAGIKALLDGADKIMSAELSDIKIAHESRRSAEAPLASKQKGLLDSYTDPSQMGYGGLRHTISPDTKFQTKAGVKTAAEMRATPGWSDSYFSQFTQVQ